MAEDSTPVFQIQRIYLKDLSLEQPNSPAIFLEQEAEVIRRTVAYLSRDINSKK